MDKAVKRYFQLKKKQKELESELSELRSEIMNYCAEQGVNELKIGRYKVKIIEQERKEYNDERLYGALPDASIWKMMSKADPTKIAGLIKLNVISEDVLKQAYEIKKVSNLLVERQ
jgi:hypothetical protein